MQTIHIEGNKRNTVGKSSSNATRRNGNIPCVIYGNGETIHFEVSEKNLQPVIYTPNAYKIILSVEGNSYDTVLREVQTHPVTDKLLHVDFLRLTEGKNVTITVPVKLEGSSKGVREGGKLFQKIRKINIKGLPENLVDSIVIDITELEVGKSIRIGDIRLNNLEVIGAPAIPIVTCNVSRAMKSAADTAAAAAPAEAAAAKAEAPKKEEAK